MLNDMERHQIAREIWLHIQLNHPSIIALYAAWKDRDYIYLVLEWAPEVRLGLRRCAGAALIGFGVSTRALAKAAAAYSPMPSLLVQRCAALLLHVEH